MLLRAAAEQAAEWAPTWIYANASTEDDGVREFLKRIGGWWVPMHTYMLPLNLEMEAPVCLGQKS